MAHSTRNFGKAFTWLGWMVTFFIMTLLFDRYLDERINPNQTVNTVHNKGYDEIVLKRNHNGHFLLNGTINGQIVTFMVDTGATTTSIPSQLARTLKLKKGYRFSIQTANGASHAYSTVVSSLKLGEIEFLNINASLNPGLDGDSILLGMNILSKMEMVLHDELLIFRRYR